MANYLRRSQEKEEERQEDQPILQPCSDLLEFLQVVDSKGRYAV